MPMRELPPMIALCAVLLACDHGVDSRANAAPSGASASRTVNAVAPVVDAAIAKRAPPPPATPIDRSSEASCKAKGGLWTIFGFQPGCALAAVDAGQACRDRADCQGDCTADESVPAGTAVIGKCYAWQHVPDTLVNRVVDGKAQGTVIIN